MFGSSEPQVIAVEQGVLRRARDRERAREEASKSLKAGIAEGLGGGMERLWDDGEVVAELMSALQKNWGRFCASFRLPGGVQGGGDVDPIMVRAAVFASDVVMSAPQVATLLMLAEAHNQKRL